MAGSADDCLAVPGGLSGVKSEWHVEQQFCGAIQHGFDHHQLDQYDFVVKFIDQPISVP